MTSRQDIHNSEVPALCRSCEARHKGICGALKAEELKKLGKQSSRIEVAAGTGLVALGARQDRFANILSGCVKVTKLMPDGRQQIVGLQFAPDLVGQPFAQDTTIAAEAASDVRLCTFARSTLEELTRSVPALERRLHEQSLRQLDEARDLLLTLGRKSALEKVASLLVYLSEHIAPMATQEQDAFTLPLSRAEIGDFLGLTEETVSRQFTALRKSGAIEVSSRKKVTITDSNELRRAAAI